MGTPFTVGHVTFGLFQEFHPYRVLENLLGFLGRVEVADEALIEATAEDRIPLGISETISGIARRDRSRSHEA